MDYKSVENILQKAMDNASEREHEYVTLEHIMLELILCTPIKKVCEELGVDVTSLQEDLENYLEGDEDNLKSQNLFLLAQPRSFRGQALILLFYK